MIRRNQRQLNLLNILTDALLVFLSYVFASWLWLGVVTKNPNMASLANLRNGSAMAAVIYALWTVAVLGMLRVYRDTRVRKLGWRFAIFRRRGTTSSTTWWWAADT